MPEGVEVKLCADLTRPLLINKNIINAFPTKNGRYSTYPISGFDHFINDIKKNPIKILGVDNKGKFMYWSFSNDWYMFSTFGMTGQWSTQEGKHSCFGFYLGDNPDIFETMYFNDPRHFGTIKFVQGKSYLNKKLEELGWDPLKSDYTDYKYFIKKKIYNNKPIGQLLMNQAIFAGVGNYIRAEALYISNISPWRLGTSLSEKEIDLLCSSIVQVMNESYQHQGATIQTYKTIYGEEGRYSTIFKVYGQNLDPLGNKVVRDTTPDGRTIHWCPAIQK